MGFLGIIILLASIRESIKVYKIKTKDLPASKTLPASPTSMQSKYSIRYYCRSCGHMFWIDKHPEYEVSHCQKCGASDLMRVATLESVEPLPTKIIRIKIVEQAKLPSASPIPSDLPLPPSPSEQGKYRSQFHCNACDRSFWVYEHRLKIPYCCECGAPDPVFVATTEQSSPQIDKRVSEVSDKLPPPPPQPKKTNWSIVILSMLVGMIVGLSTIYFALYIPLYNEKARAESEVASLTTQLMEANQSINDLNVQLNDYSTLVTSLHNEIAALNTRIYQILYNKSQFNPLEWIEIKSASVILDPTTRLYVVTLQYFNTGPTSTSIDSIMLNNVPYSNFSPTLTLGGDFIADIFCPVGIIRIGTICFYQYTEDPSGNRLTSGVTLTINLHSSGGNDYYTCVILP